MAKTMELRNKDKTNPTENDVSTMKADLAHGHDALRSGFFRWLDEQA